MRRALSAIAFAVGAATWAACSTTGGAPDFTLRDDTGTPWRLAQQRGSAVLLIDPKRDTVAAMHRFVSRFAGLRDRRIVGLTGTPAQIERVKSAYHIWSQPLRNGDIAHTAAIVFIDPQGRISATADDDDSDASLSRALTAMLAS